jgi:hypothetical protein
MAHPGGRPPRQYDQAEARLVQAVAQYREPQEEIAARLGMSVETLMKLYRAEYEKGRREADTKVRKKLLDEALGGNTAALLFYCKTQLGMRETNRVEMTSPDGSMSPLDVKVEFVKPQRDE